MLILMASLMAMVSLAVHADAVNTVSNVVTTLSTANAVSAPFNPYSALIAALLQVGGPLAMFLAGVFSHKSGVAAGQGGVK